MTSRPSLTRALPKAPPSSARPLAFSDAKKSREMRKSTARTAMVPTGWAVKPPDSHQSGTAVRSKVGMVVMAPPLRR